MKITMDVIINSKLTKCCPKKLDRKICTYCCAEHESGGAEQPTEHGHPAATELLHHDTGQRAAEQRHRQEQRVDPRGFALAGLELFEQLHVDETKAVADAVLDQRDHQ